MVRFFCSEDGAARAAPALGVGWCAVAIVIACGVIGMAQPAHAAYDCPSCGCGGLDAYQCETARCQWHGNGCDQAYPHWRKDECCNPGSPCWCSSPRI